MTFLSPALFLLIILVAIYLIIRRNRNAAIFILAVLFLTIYSLSITPVKDLILSPLEDKYLPIDLDKTERVDAIVILGGGVQASPEDKSGYVLSDSTFKRLYFGYQIYKKTDLELIVSGGAPLRVGPPEADIMAQTLKLFGVPEDKIITERQSNNTYENIQNISPILTHMSAKKIFLVTSAAHLPRSMKIVKNFNIDAIPVPCDYKTGGKGLKWYDFFPSAGNLELSFSALKEYIGTLYYKLYYNI